MATRQYIGARYVPKIDGIWNVNKSYEALSVVTYMGASYTSKKSVPVGISITNEEYWVLTGNYNSQVEEYRQEVERVTTELNKKENKTVKMIMIGDSYGANNYGNIDTFFWQIIRSRLNLYEGISFFHNFSSGAGFGDIPNAPSNNCFYGLLRDLNVPNKEEITDIFVCGGWNDSDVAQPYGTDEAFYNGVSEFDNYIKANYPNARVTLACISWGNVNALDDGLYEKMWTCLNRYFSVSSAHNWKWVNNANLILHNYSQSWWQADNAHPTQKGQNALGEYLTSGFKNGNCNVIRITSTEEVQPSGICYGSDRNINLAFSMYNGFIHGVTVSLADYDTFYTIENAQTLLCDGKTEYEIGTVNSEICSGMKNYVVSNGNITVQTTDGNRYNVSAKFIMRHGKLYVLPFGNISGSIRMIENAKYIFIQGLNFTANALQC